MTDISTTQTPSEDKPTAVSTIKSWFGPSNHIGAHILAAVISVSFLIVILVFALHIVQESPMLNVLLGALAQQFGQTCNYYFGDSFSSAQKSDHINSLLQNNLMQQNPSNPTNN